MKRKGRLVAAGIGGAAVAVVLLYAFGATAHGEHKRGVWVKNHYSEPVTVAVFNGDDAVCGVAHGVHTIQPGETKKVKCHTGSKNKCRVWTTGDNKCDRKGADCIGIKRAETGHIRVKNGTCLEIRRD